MPISQKRNMAIINIEICSEISCKSCFLELGWCRKNGGNVGENTRKWDFIGSKLGFMCLKMDFTSFHNWNSNRIKSVITPEKALYKATDYRVG